MNLRNPELNEPIPSNPHMKKILQQTGKKRQALLFTLDVPNCLGVSKPVFYELSSRLRYPLIRGPSPWVRVRAITRLALTRRRPFIRIDADLSLQLDKVGRPPELVAAR